MAFTNLVNYIKKVWKDAPSTDTPINAVNLNHMENGISDAATAINQLGQNLTAGDDLRFQFSKSGNKYGYKDANGAFHPFRTAHTGTYNATSRSAALDMGEDHSYRYVNTNNIQTSGTYTATSNGTKDMGATNNYRYVNVQIPNIISSGECVYKSEINDNGYGQTITYTYTAAESRNYFAIAYSYSGDNMEITSHGFSTTGIILAENGQKRTSNQRAMCISTALVYLSVGQTISGIIPAPWGSWPARGMLVFSV